MNTSQKRKSRRSKNLPRIRENWPEKAGNTKIALMKAATHKITTNRKTAIKLTEVQIQTQMDSQSSNFREYRIQTESDHQTMTSWKHRILRWVLKGTTTKSHLTLIYLQPQIHQNGSEITIIYLLRTAKKCSLTKYLHYIFTV